MSQAGIVDIEGSHPQLPTMFVTNSGTAVPIANVLEILGTAVAAHSIPLETTGSGNTVTIEVQYASSSASSVANKAGVASFNSADFSVDANGYVTLSGSSALTFHGDTGSAVPSGNIITIFADNTANNAGSSVLFVASAAQVQLNVTDANGNTMLGSGAGNAALTGTNNAAFGNLALHSLTTGNFNVAVGSQCLQSLVSGVQNTGIGFGALHSATGQNNTAVGFGAGNSITTGIKNTLLGVEAGLNLTTGSYNIIIGDEIGLSYSSSESSNILIGGVGVLGESNVIRIGDQGSSSAEQDTCYIAGIVGVTASSSEAVFINSTTGQLGVIPQSSDGQVIIGSSAGSPLAATLTAGTGISISNGHNSITIAATGSEMTWTDEATSFNALAGNGYFITANATATLPASPTQGNLIAFTVDAAATTVTITANTGQVIRLGTAVSASAGTATNNARGDSITLVYRSSDTAWIASSSIGVWTIT